jgi:hypothetical protein
VKKLQVKTAQGWAWVFCRNLDTSSIQTTPEKRQALPSLAMWGADDLAYFHRFFPAAQLRLAADLDA